MKNRLSARLRRRSQKNVLEFEPLENRKLMAADIAAIDLQSLMSSPDTAPAMVAPSTVHQHAISTDQGANAPSARIVNGQQTSEFTAVGYVGTGCTGTLISPSHVLTAAHCLENVGNRGVTFEVGGQTYRSSAVTLHPEYNANRFDAGNDLAIITLSRPVTGITPMELFRQTPQVGMNLTLVGFGEGGTSTGGFDPNDDGKQVGETRLDVVTGEHIAWNFDSHNEANTAPGDSGGPAFVNINGNFQIAGVTSGGTGNAQSLGDYSFDTRIDIHAAWIDGIVGNSDSGNDNDGGDESDTDGGDDGGNETDDHSSRPDSNATLLTLNSSGNGTTTGTLEESGDRDAFRFTVDAAGETTIALTATDRGLDTYLRVYDSGGRLVAQNDDAGGSLNSQLTTSLGAGDYYAVAGAYADESTGEYSLQVNHVADDNGGGDESGTYTFENNQSQEISEFGTDRVVSTINVSGTQGAITDVNVTVDIDHSYVSDLRLVLVSPSGQRVVLVNQQGGSGNGFDNTVFDSDADQSINRGRAPFSGTFRPARSLDRLDGQDANGQWRLIVQDRADLDGGQLNGWSLDIATSDGSRAESSFANLADSDDSSDQLHGADEVTPVSPSYGFAAFASFASFENNESSSGRNQRDNDAVCRRNIVDQVFSEIDWMV